MLITALGTAICPHRFQLLTRSVFKPDTMILCSTSAQQKQCWLRKRCVPVVQFWSGVSRQREKYNRRDADAEKGVICVCRAVFAPSHKGKWKTPSWGRWQDSAIVSCHLSFGLSCMACSWQQVPQLGTLSCITQVNRAVILQIYVCILSVCLWCETPKTALKLRV